MGKRNSGVSLITILVGLVLMGVVITSLFHLLGNANNAQFLAEQRSDIVSLSQYLETNVDCIKTKAALASACSDGSLITAQRADGSAIGAQIGKYPVRVTCVVCTSCPGGKKLLFEAEVRGPRPSNPKEWKDIHRGIPFGCSLL